MQICPSCLERLLWRRSDDDTLISTSERALGGNINPIDRPRLGPNPPLIGHAAQGEDYTALIGKLLHDIIIR